MINRTSDLTFGEFLLIQDCIANPEQIWEQVKEWPKPEKIGGQKVPDNLNGLTYGQFIGLTQLGERLLTDAPRVIFGVCDITEDLASDVLSFGYWVSKELERIGKLFASTAIEPTAEEKEAGIQDTNVGVFGTIDWFALRMHISHEEVTKISWMIIYQCLDIEARRARFNRRLREVHARKAKAKQK